MNAPLSLQSSVSTAEYRVELGVDYLVMVEKSPYHLSPSVYPFLHLSTQALEYSECLPRCPFQQKFKYRRFFFTVQDTSIEVCLRFCCPDWILS